jgi:hypothetical protein
MPAEDLELSDSERALLRYYEYVVANKGVPPSWAANPTYFVSYFLHARVDLRPDGSAELTAARGAGVYPAASSAMLARQVHDPRAQLRMWPHARATVVSFLEAFARVRCLSLVEIAGLECVVERERNQVVVALTDPGLSGSFGSLDSALARLNTTIKLRLRLPR